AGRSLWRKRVTSTYGTAAVKAKTVFPPKPPQWPESEKWIPDVCFSLVQQQLLNGKSIGFLPLKVREPNDAERQTYGKKADSIIEEWLLLEYACVYLPRSRTRWWRRCRRAAPNPSASARLGGSRAGARLRRLWRKSLSAICRLTSESRKDL